ncbi:MAG: sugar-binding protein [Desulfobacterales bacterium]|nr:sugar-binding protein [Desulfobacterales bacterium]
MVSNTDHFTDMINAVVQVPESPQKTSFNPTQIKDIKVANPGAKVNVIEPPQANNQGDARLSYPIEIPPGRKGMQPQLGVQYSSGGGNGWMGLGWDLSMQGVSIDTRWGVPRYDAGKETETYTLSGQQLTPVAHRGELVSRTSEKEFHSRTEGAFQKIIRHGDHPVNYWWEVTDKNGTHFIYGGTGNSVLTDYSGNIAKWALRMVKDSNGNNIIYQYARQQDSGIGNDSGSVPGYDLYLANVFYTGYGDEQGPYQVKFIRDRNLGESRRADVTIDARLGFKKVTADLLRKVEVLYNEKLIRSYEFGYVEGAFKKTLLKIITQFDNQGKVFNSHQFEYFDEARNTNGGYLGFGAGETWDTRNDNVDAGLFLEGEASALGGTESSSNGQHLYVGISFSGPKKDTSVGGKVGSSRTKSKGMLAFTDINGDGLPDKVFGSGSVFRPNLSGPGGIAKFGDPVPITMGDISREKSNMTSKGVEAYFGATVGINRSKTFTETSAFLSDVNGDGLIDLVKSGTVRFGLPDDPEKTRPAPRYSSNSSATPYPIGGGAVAGEQLFENFEQLYQEMLDDNPLHDTLRRWTAPFDGQVSISGDITLIEDTSSERSEYTTADGVRVAIQHNGSELWAAVVEADDYSPVASGMESVSVQQGDRIYFRVQSRFDGAYDQVRWDPKIEYLNVEAVKDANNLNPYVYQAGEDFIPTGRSNLSTTMPATGTVSLTGDVEKLAQTSDDIRVVALLNDIEVFSHISDSGQIETTGVNLNLNVNQEDQLKLKIEADSPVDLAQVRWKPHLEYTSAQGADSVYDHEGNPVLVFDPPYLADVYGENDLDGLHEMWTATESGELDVMASVITSASSGVLVLTVKRVNELAGKAVFDLSEAVSNGSIIKFNGVYKLNLGLTMTVAQDDLLTFSLSTRDRLLAQRISSYDISARYNSSKDTVKDNTANDDVTDSHAGGSGNDKDSIGDGAANDDAYDDSYGSSSDSPLIMLPGALYFPAEESLFSQPYRGWTYAGYNGNRDRADQAIIESDLVLSFDQSQYDRNRQVTDPEELDAQSSPEKAKAVMFFPDPAFDRWRGYDDGTWIKAEVQSSSRLNADYISVPRPGNYAGASAVNRLSKSTQTGFFAGGGPVSGSYTIGKSRALLDFMDMNGDRFPDVISESCIQYSPMIGGLEGSSKPVISGIREIETEAKSFGIGGNFAQVKFGGSGDGKSSGLQMPPLGISANFGDSENEHNYDLNDINGDGLPDKIYDNGDAALNLGYKFAAREHWGGVSAGKGDGNSLNLGASIGFNDGIYGFGGGVSLSQSESEAKVAWIDINGDGLADYLQKGGSVSLNTGNGFTSLNYPGVGDFSENINTGQNGGAYFTISIPIPLTPICIIINPGFDISKGMGRPEVSIRDIDGDGYADRLSSDKDSKIEVRRNRIGRTNMLKTVKRPLGASFSIEYERDGNTYQLPQSRWNMTRVEVVDGFAGDGVDKLVTTYEYEDGFHHRREREFFGYKTVKTQQRNAGDNDSLYRGTVQTFMNRNYYEKGLVVSEVVTDAQGKKYLETINKYQLRDVGTNKILEGEFKDSLTATVFPEFIRTDKKFYEGQENAGISTYQTFEYDALGNVTHFFDAADTGAGDDVESFIGYHSDLANYIVGKADNIVVKGNGKVMRERGAAFENGTGNLKQVRLSFGSGTAVHDMGYDKYGNIISQTGPPNKKGQRYSLTYTYDTDVHTYVKKIQDSFGYVSEAEYDLKWGEITSSTDINKQSISYRHDSVGRVKGITGPYQQSKGCETLVFDYYPGADVPWALTRHYDNYQQKSDPLETVVFIDGLKRGLQTKKDGDVSSGNANTRDVMIVSGRVIFDFVGRVVEQYYPITESLGHQGKFNSGFDNVQPTRTSHDVVDRVLITTIPDNTSIKFGYGFGTDRNGKVRFETRVTDANNKSKVTYKDVRELITSVKEFNKGNTIWTSYMYDPVRQIAEVRDNNSNITAVQYDLMGRRTHINSPDAGLTEYVYDPASNVVKKISANLRAKGKAVEYDYTYNRLDKILYPDYTENNVTYTYGPPGAAYNRADRIVTVTDESGNEERFYGPLGETVKTVKYVTSETEGNSSNSPEIYITEYKYDTYNRLRQLIYPDAEILTYSYNSGGLAESVSGVKGDYTYPYLKALTYDKFEQRVYMKQGNGAETNYSYNPLNRRLSTLKAKSGGRQFMDLSYGYDLVGNIMKLDNWAKVNKPYEFGGETHYSFDYDDLYRLTGSSGNLKQKPNTEHKYTLSMEYNNIHNIVGKNQQHVRITPSGSSILQKKTSYDYSYDYGSSRPHAPTHIGDRTFSYDANGNQTGWESDKNGTRRNISWDEENRIQVIEDNGHTMTYKYNDAGERVFKTGPQGETCYVNQFYSVRNREVGSKHVFVGTGRIATKMVKGQENVTTPASETDHSGNSDPSGNAYGHEKDNNGGGSGGSLNKGKIIYEPDIYYYHADHLGSSTFISDVDGELYQHLINFPFGETWVEESTNTQRTPYHFTAKELDEETGLYFFGGRYYDPRTSVWQSCDPILADYLPTGDKEKDKKLPGNGGVFNTANLSLYAYVAHNPIKYIDPDGEKIVLADKKDKAQIEAYINSRARGLFEFKKISGTGQYELKMTRSTGKAGYSEYYRDKLEAAINDPDTITVDISGAYTEGGVRKNIDADAGGGVTQSSGTRDASGNVNWTNSDVIISGNWNKTMKNQRGNKVGAHPADILVHELVGHAIPKIAGSDTGNAIINSNKVTNQLGGKAPLRLVEPHPE